ncbi:MAG: hypothetical protein ACKVPX_03305 [Myxococcaceae bacterium]
MTGEVVFPSVAPGMEAISVRFNGDPRLRPGEIHRCNPARTGDGVLTHRARKLGAREQPKRTLLKRACHAEGISGLVAKEFSKTTNARPVPVLVL